ncbi:hypothetical protein [Bartonella sp. LB28NMGDW]|uniref:hypothetical protein n=1 Tax=Bartonella sp. LB28NMGDW TaxID=3243549 RepID=UPI0035D03FFB
MRAALGQEQAFLLLQLLPVDQDPQNQPLRSEEVSLFQVQDAEGIKLGHVKIEKRQRKSKDDRLEGCLVKKL